ncbi:hypothetical protein ACWCP6_32125 [Streptomyces sp. NPDC002004]
MTAQTPAAAGAARADLLSLTPETLAAIANRGLVKRAAREVDAGNGPTVSADGSGAVLARYADGTRTELPAGAALDAAVCGCGAAGVCRHVIGLVLAYGQEAAGDPSGGDAAATDTSGESAPQEPMPGEAPAGSPTGEAESSGTPSGEAPSGATPSSAALSLEKPAGRTPSEAEEPAASDGSEEAPQVWSPAAVDDGALTAAVGARAVSAARRTRDRGYTARVHRPTAEQPVPWVELPSCTVRFPVPGAMAYALTDAATELRGEVTALAVWAFRAADDQAPGEEVAQVTVGGAMAGADRALRLLDSAVDLADTILWEGTAHAGPVLTASVGRTAADLAAASLHWPAGAARDLADQLAAYTDRAARYHPQRPAELLAELHARRRAAGSPEALGTREPGETPLRRVRLTGLGARITGTAERPVAEVYFAHSDSGVVLVLRKEWKQPEGAPSAQAFGGRRVLGTTLAALAAGNVVSENAKRTASRALSLSRGRLGATTVTPVGRSWLDLPGPLLVRDLEAHTARWSERPPRPIRPRVEAESVHATEVSGVTAVGYDPAGQRLEAIVLDGAGNEALLTATHNPLAPQALDALAEALTSGEVRCVTGTLHRTGGRTAITPLSLLTAAGDTVTPDLSPLGTVPVPLPALPHRAPDPLGSALTPALDALAALAHQGLRHTTPVALSRLRDEAVRLAHVGLRDCSAAVAALRDALAGDDPARATTSWTAAYLRLLVTTELLEPDGS